MQLGYSTWGMPTVPIDVSIKHLSDLGFDAIEITVLPHFTTGLAKLDSSERRRIANLLKQHKLALSACLLYTSPSPRDRTRSRMPSSA